MKEASFLRIWKTNVTVNIRKSSDVPYVTYEAAADSVATDKLYEIAAQIVKLLAG